MRAAAAGWRDNHTDSEDNSDSAANTTTKGSTFELQYAPYFYSILNIFITIFMVAGYLPIFFLVIRMFLEYNIFLIVSFCQKECKDSNITYLVFTFSLDSNIVMLFYVPTLSLTALRK